MTLNKMGENYKSGNLRSVDREIETISNEKKIDQCSDANSRMERLTMEALNILVEATKSSNRLPNGKSRDLYESCPAFQRISKFYEQKALSNITKILKHINFKGNVLKGDDEDKLEMIVDVNDFLLERVSISLDDISGVNMHSNSNLSAQASDFCSGSQKKTEHISNIESTQIINIILMKTKNMEKPQLQFSEAINNDEKIPFEPRIKYKYNMLKPLAVIAETNERGILKYSHPYEFELTKFKPGDWQLKYQDPMMFKPLDETPLKFISEKKDVPILIEELLKHKEIAVDLEHHSFRSFQGFTCLMQISTRDTDYIVDTLPLRSELQELNKVFTNPSIVKIFHGADSDVLWLQRDLSIYVVNMFDTHIAAKLLSFPNLSLAYLLKIYCKVNAKKHFQLADWRIRPLPEELLTYAREDTHYLLYIYDKLKNKLIERGNGDLNLLKSVFSESSHICLKTYDKPMFDQNGHLDIYHRSKKLFDNRQKCALQRLFEWRDKTARDLDESLAFVMPNHMMLNISEILPREAQGILACCNPVPLPVRQNLLKLHEIILKAREEPLVKPILEELQYFRHPSAIVSADHPLYCPHDLNHDGEFRDDLPVLLTRVAEKTISNVEISGENNVKKIGQPTINVFESSVPFVNLMNSESVYHFPYSRYKLAKKFSESSEIQNAAGKIKCDNKDLQKASDASSPSDVRHLNHSKKETNATADRKLQTSREKKNIPDVDESSEVSVKRTFNQNLETSCSKKIKVENIESISNLSNESHLSQNKYVESAAKKMGSKRSHRKTTYDKQFVPYNYGSVSFDKYKKFTIPSKRKSHKKIQREKKLQDR